MTSARRRAGFFFAALAQLAPRSARSSPRVLRLLLGAYPHCEFGPGDFNRAIRAALVGLWVPPPMPELKTPPRWARASPRFSAPIPTRVPATSIARCGRR